MNITDNTKLQLYTRAAELFALAPWQWMYDTDLFAVQHPESGERGYCCVLGNAGEVFGLAVYKGDAGLASYDDILMEGMIDGDTISPEDTVLIQNCLMVSFGDQELLSKEQKDELRRLRIAVAQPNGHPVFEDFTPGLVPWALETEAQAALLLCAIEQTIDVATRYKEHTEMLTPPAEMPDGMLLRSAEGSEWQDSWIEITEYNIQPRGVKVEPAAVKSAVAALAKRPKTAWLITFFSLPSPAQDDPAERPYFPEMMLVVDLATGQIIGQDMFAHEQLEETLQASFIEVVQEAGFIPERILVPYEEDGDVIAEICAAADIEWEYNEETQELAEGIENMLMEHLGLGSSDGMFDFNEN